MGAIRPLDLPTLLTGVAENLDTGLSVSATGQVHLTNSGMTVPTEVETAMAAAGLAYASGTLTTSDESGGSVNVE